MSRQNGENHEMPPGVSLTGNGLLTTLTTTENNNENKNKNAQAMAASHEPSAGQPRSQSNEAGIIEQDADANERETATGRQRKPAHRKLRRPRSIDPKAWKKMSTEDKEEASDKEYMRREEVKHAEALKKAAKAAAVIDEAVAARLKGPMKDMKEEIQHLQASNSQCKMFEEAMARQALEMATLKELVDWQALRITSLEDFVNQRIPVIDRHTRDIVSVKSAVEKCNNLHTFDAWLAFDNGLRVEHRMQQELYCLYKSNFDLKRWENADEWFEPLEYKAMEQWETIPVKWAVEPSEEPTTDGGAPGVTGGAAATSEAPNVAGRATATRGAHSPNRGGLSPNGATRDGADGGDRTGQQITTAQQEQLIGQQRGGPGNRGGHAGRGGRRT